MKYIIKKWEYNSWEIWSAIGVMFSGLMAITFLASHSI